MCVLSRVQIVQCLQRKADNNFLLQNAMLFEMELCSETNTSIIIPQSSELDVLVVVLVLIDITTKWKHYILNRVPLYLLYLFAFL